MSNQPPPAFGGHPNYAAQWPPTFPSLIPPSYPPTSEYASAAQPSPANPGQSYDFNITALNGNSQLPGPPPGFFFPPHFPLMGQFDPSQLPPSAFPPMPMPNFGYPPMPFAPPGSSNHAPGSFNELTNGLAQTSVSRPQARQASNTADSNREEGEVSEGGRSFRTKKLSETVKQAGLNVPASRYSDLEEGETVSSGSRSSSRSSSPYNPPLSVSADPAVVHRAIEVQKRDATAAASDDAAPPKSAAQLRIQAQGALLSLAPHNIRYHELIAEGINPAILKRLYEEVGIKITTPQREEPTPTTTASGNSLKASIASPRTIEVPTSEKNQKQTPSTVQSIASPASQSDEGKPLERKELIARMLAAKAAKVSEAKIEQTPTQTSASVASTSSNGTSGKEIAVPVRERNKAQTELARQRIEQLKKQALLKRQQQAEQQAQQQAQQLTLPGKSVQDAQFADLSEPVAPAVQHPLPVRPPVPQSAEPQSAEPASIPGLLMTGSQQDSGMQTPVEATPTIVVDSTPVSRATQRKRPRAADFDEPAAIPKRHSSQAVAHHGPAEKLIIDISEDEYLYGDDEEDNMDVDSNPDQGASHLVTIETARPLLHKYPSTRASTSTPQGSYRPGDQEHIRKRESEIEAMHRKIAELEQKRKAKLAASRTQSPFLDDSGASSSGAQSSVPEAEAEAEVAETSTAPSSGPILEAGTATSMSISSVADQPNPIGSFTDETSTSPLSHKDELPQRAGLELNEHHLAVEEGTVILSTIDCATPAEYVEQPLDAPISGQEAAVDFSESREYTPGSPINGSTANQGANGVDLPPSTRSNSPGSAMDESVDPDHNTSFEETDLYGLQDTHSVSGMEEQMNTGHIDHSLHRELPVTGSEEEDKPLNVFEDYDPEDENAKIQREYSPESDVYEPPEPGTGADEPDAIVEEDATEADESYSPPPFSPAPIEEFVELPHSRDQDPVEDSAASPRSRDQPQHEALTWARPGPYLSEPRRDFQIGIFSDQPKSSKFTPYVSPLRSFKAYRYHPNYAEDVSDGYRSLTYSHDIDTMKYFCPYEVAGGVCNDRSCDFQHFRDINLSDDKILIEMGAVREGQTEEEKETYIAGLKEIINEMRRDKVKEFSTVAAEIAAYRRRFLQDPSRVLPL
ncbi:hypothetical protein N7526_005548 [Penicillium atrosanguineum]|nr:hypothetical protein N7526_005548 [Penicillium atrosanguineum]